MLLTTKEAAEELRISEVTLRKSRCTGVLLGEDPPLHLKLGPLVRYRVSDIEAWAERVGLNYRETGEHSHV